MEASEKLHHFVEEEEEETKPRGRGGRGGGGGRGGRGGRRAAKSKDDFIDDSEEEVPDTYE
jgi:hypothetical protein